MNKFRIIHVIHDFLNGGIESFLYYLSKEQTKNELLDVSILCLQNENEIINPRIKEIGINIIYIQIKPLEINIFKYLKILRLLKKYDLIHLHTFKPILCFFLNFSKVKKTFTVHSSGSILRPKTLGFKIKNVLLKNFLNHSINGIAHNSEYTKEFWTKKGVINSINIVIYNGVFFNNNYDPQNCYNEFPQLKGKKIIGTTSRLILWKRVDILLRAFASMKNKTSESILLIVGDGPEKNNLLKLCKNLKIDNQVLFTGYKRNVTDFQSIIDICVFPSVSEPFGLVAIECLHLGKPVLVLKDGGGITELVSGIEPNNIADSTFQLITLLEQLYERQSFIEPEIIKKRIDYSENYSVKHTEIEYYNLYSSIINS